MINSFTIRSFLTSVLLWSLTAYGQEDVTFPNVSAEFEETWYCLDATNGPYNMYVSHQYTAEPSLDSLGFTWGQFDWFGEDQFIAVDASKVLILNSWLSDSILTLYDFGLQVNDTAYQDIYMGIDYYAIITAIDTTNIQGRYRKRFFLSNEDIWIEGIGSLQGVLRPIWETPLGCAPGTYTFCANYIDSNSVAYTWCSDLVMNEEEIGPADPRVYPIPCNDQLTIRSDRPGEIFQLLDMEGRILRSGNLKTDHHSLDVSDLAPGMYLLLMANWTAKVFVE